MDRWYYHDLEETSRPMEASQRYMEHQLKFLSFENFNQDNKKPLNVGSGHLYLTIQDETMKTCKIIPFLLN